VFDFHHIVCSFEVKKRGESKFEEQGKNDALVEKVAGIVT